MDVDVSPVTSRLHLHYFELNALLLQTRESQDTLELVSSLR